MRLASLALAATLALAAPVRAQEDAGRAAFLEANILSIFYHELGHAVIDLMDVPIFGQEEDAADVLSVLLIDWLFEEDAAQDIARDSAFGYLEDPDGVEEVAYWDLHGPDEQRFYNHVCLFYGAAPAAREGLAGELGLPRDRAETCPEEYEQAAASWGGVFDAMEDAGTGVPMVFVPGQGADTALPNRILSAETRGMNGELTLPRQLTVRVETCGEPNAFYDPEAVSVVFCTEFVAHLSDLHDRLSAE